MAFFGTVSAKRLITCHQSIQAVMNMAVTDYDFSVLCGHRDKKAQNAAFNSGASKLRFPDSNHNSKPSMAVDIVPYPIDWDNLHRFHELSVVIKYHAWKLGVRLDNGFDLWGWDMPHWELRE